MDQNQALQSIIQNLREKTGKSLEKWVDIVKARNLEKHGQIVKFLKSEHEFTHGYANLVAHRVLNPVTATGGDNNDLIENQFSGKEHFRPLFDEILGIVKSFGEDVEIAPKKATVSLRRKKQFALLKPATKSRFEVGINLKEHPAKGMLEETKASNAMCSHVIKLTVDDKVNDELISWLKKAYDEAG